MSEQFVKTYRDTLSTSKDEFTLAGKVAYGALQMLAGGREFFFASYPDVAELAGGYSERWAQDAVRECERLGLVERVRSGDSRGRANEYRLLDRRAVTKPRKDSSGVPRRNSGPTPGRIVPRPRKNPSAQ